MLQLTGELCDVLGFPDLRFQLVVLFFVWYNAVRYNAIQYRTVRCNKVRFGVDDDHQLVSCPVEHQAPSPRVSCLVPVFCNVYRTLAFYTTAALPPLCVFLSVQFSAGCPVTNDKTISHVFKVLMKALLIAGLPLPSPSSLHLMDPTVLAWLADPQLVGLHV